MRVSKHTHIGLSKKLILSLVSSFLLSSQTLHSETKTKVVAITQIVTHKSLDEAKSGILNQLQQEGFEVGKNLKLIQENAHGNIATANLIAKKFVGNKDIDVIIPISTPSAISVLSASKQSSIPIVFSSVSDPLAAGLIKDLNKADLRVTGAMDLPDLVQTQNLIKTLVPKAKRLGLIYNPGEANSVKTVQALKNTLDASFTLVETSVPNSNLVPDAVRSLVDKVDALFIPSDNTVFSALAKLIQITRTHKIPTFTNDPDSVHLGIFACHGYSQYAVGQVAGSLVAKILQGERSLLVKTPEKADVFVKTKTANILGVSVPKMFHKIVINKIE